MGRWAQRRRGKGGGGRAALIVITNAELIPPEVAILTYSAEVDATDFAGGNFTSNPSTEPGTGVAQDSPNSIEVTFGGDITTDASITYVGAVSGVQSPQTIAYS